LAATAPPTPNRTCLITPVDVSNWENDVYLTVHSMVTCIGSRFTKLESDRPRVVFHQKSSPSTFPFHQHSLPYRSWLMTVPQYHCLHLSIPQFHDVCSPDLPRFAEPELLCCAMVHDLVQPLSNLHPSPHTIPTLDIPSPFVLCLPHHSYFPHQSFSPFPISQLPIYSVKNSQHN
jgi:hypothetical protein